MVLLFLQAVALEPPTGRIMGRATEAIISDLEAFTASDFDWDDETADGDERLWQLCDEIAACPDRRACAEAMFALMERLDMVELGTPGPLVHTLEAWKGLYEPWLAESLRRKPSPLTVWMANRILNGEPAEDEVWLNLLAQAQEHPEPNAATRAEAARFLQYQQDR